MTVELPSVCPLDCPDTCSLAVTVEGDRLVKIRGTTANPLTSGVLCNKVTHYYPEFVHGENRVRYPQKRVGVKGEGRFERISWDEALDIVHARFREIIEHHGPEAILPLNYAGPHGMLAYASMDQRFFHRLGASKLERAPLCGGIRGEAWAGTFGATPGIPPQQIADSRLIVAWGNNVTYTNLHLAPLVNRARKQGAKLVVVDPKRVKIAEQADMHLAVRPGTDVVLAFAVACALERNGGFDAAFIAEHVHGFESFMTEARLFPPVTAAEVCGVPAEDIRAFAALYRDSSPAAIAIGNGLERNRNGGNSIRAVFALPALAGKFGVHGGGLVMGMGHAFPKTASRLTRPDLTPEGTRTIHILDVGRHLVEDDVDPPIRGLFIYNHNPVIVHPDQNRMKQALGRDDLFTVGAEVAMTDSMVYCDVVLPACTHFEFDDVYPAYGHQFLQRAEPVIPAVGESLPNTEIFRRLAARFGFNGPTFEADDRALINEALDAGDPRLQGLRPSEVPTDRAIPMLLDGAEPVMFHNVRPRTPTGKVELESSYLADRHGEAVPTYRPVESRYPLALVSPASDRRITSTFGGLRWSDEAPPLEMHPDDAAARGLSDGMTARVWNDRGEVHLTLRVTDAVRSGCVFSYKGAWFRTSDNGQTITALTPAHHADLGGACFNDARVEVEAYEPAATATA